MYVLIDLLTRPSDVAVWFDVVHARDDKTLNLQEFPAIGFATLEITPAQFEEARRRGLSVEPVRSLRPPPIEIGGGAKGWVDYLRAPGDSWNLELIGRSDLRATGEAIRVGHIDTGIDPKHPALAGHPARFRTIAQNGSSVESRDTRRPFDTCGHGTITASVLCGNPMGVAPKVSLYVAALLGHTWTDAMLVAAVDWMIAMEVRVVWVGVERPLETSQAHEIQMIRLRAHGILPVTAVGNTGKGTSSTPGNSRHAFSTGAVRRGMPEPTMWEMSCSQEIAGLLKPDVVTPGHEVPAAKIVRRRTGTEYKVVSASGTSISGPQLAGLAALCLDLKDTLTVSELIDGIQRGSRRVNLELERANHGVPLGEAIKKALGL